ncbi:MAG: YihY/virulence factor BrkB family protein [Ectobacillus sp.]
MKAMLSNIRIHSIATFLRDLYVRTRDDDVAGLASQLAYFFLLSLFPALVFLMTMIGYLPIETEDVLKLLREYAPADAMDLLEGNIKKVLQKENGGLLSFGILGTIWAASNGINAIMNAFNKAYDIKETRPFYITRVLSIVLTLSMVFVIVFALVLPVFGNLIGKTIAQALGLSDGFKFGWKVFRLFLSFLVLFVVFSFLYKFAPNRKVRPKEVVSGALFASIGWILVSYLFAFYVERFGNYADTYGGLGAIIILMLWFYLTAWVILLGGEINALLNCYRIHGKDSHHKK